MRWSRAVAGAARRCARAARSDHPGSGRLGRNRRGARGGDAGAERVTRARGRQRRRASGAGLLGFHGQRGRSARWITARERRSTARALRIEERPAGRSSRFLRGSLGLGSLGVLCRAALFPGGVLAGATEAFTTTGSGILGSRHAALPSRSRPPCPAKCGRGRSKTPREQPDVRAAATTETLLRTGDDPAFGPAGARPT
jgi:hypothetical protein